MKKSYTRTALIVLVIALAFGGCDLLAAPEGIPREPEVRTVEGVTTDVAAVVGTFAAGPVNRPFLLESMAEFTEYYGGVDPLTNDELAALTTEQIIPLTDQPVRLFGARSLATDASEFTYIHVRRLALYVDALVNEKLSSTTGETLGSDLWDRTRADAMATLNELWRLGAFAGASPDEGYFIRSDASVHSAGDMDRNRLRVLIGFAPLRPEEFIVRVLTFDL